MVDPIALKDFFEKAQRLRPNQSTTLPNNLDLTSTDTNALLAFTANEEELTQLKQRVNEAETKLQQLESSSVDKQLKEEHKKVILINKRISRREKPLILVGNRIEKRIRNIILINRTI